MPKSRNGLEQREWSGDDQELRTYSSESLFGGEREIAIAHGQQRYLLRITRQGKLILNKKAAGR